MKIPKTARQIKNSKDYVDIDGIVYSLRSNYKGIISNIVFIKSQYLNNKCGYLYVGIKYNNMKHCISRRVNRLVAETFIPNPDNLPIVGHKNNIKTDNRVENLYWTTYSDNSQKAVDDGLLVNDKGYKDSQLKSVNMYDTLTNKLIASYGSIGEASRITGVSQTTICRQAKYKRPVRKPFYFRYQDDPSRISNKIIAKIDFKTDKLLDIYFSIANAAKKNNMVDKVISQQVNLGRKPKYTKNGFYFKYLN